MKFEYLLLVTLLEGLLPLCFSCGGGNGGHGGDGKGPNSKGGDGGKGGGGFLIGDGGHGGNGGNAGKDGTPGKGGQGGKGGFLGKDGKDGDHGRTEMRKKRAIKRLLKSLANDSSFAKRNFIPKFNIVKEIRDGKITREEFTNILKRPDLEKILFWKLDADSDDAITCQEIEARKLLHIVEGC